MCPTRCSSSSASSTAELKPEVCQRPRPVAVPRLPIDGKVREPRRGTFAAHPAPFSGIGHQNSGGFSQAGEEMDIGVADADIFVERPEHGEERGKVVAQLGQIAESALEPRAEL